MVHRPLPILACALWLCAATSMVEGANPGGSLWHRDVDAAWKHAKQTRRPLVLLFTTDGCLHCDKMSREISADQAVAKNLAESFVPTIVHANDHPGLVKKLGIVAFPTTVIISPDAKVLDAVTGYVEPVELQGHLRSASVARVPY